MRIQADQLLTDGFRLELPLAGGVLTGALGEPSGVSGTYEMGDGSMVIDVKSTPELALTSLQFELPSLRLESREPATLMGVTVKLTIPSGDGSGPMTGLVEVEKVGLPSVHGQLDGVAFQTALEAKGLRVEFRDDGAILVTADDLRLHQVSLDLTVKGPDPESSALAEEGGAAPGDGTSAAPRVTPLDLSVLDGLSGDAAADVTVAVRVPVIGEIRRHYDLRVPVAEGAIDYKAVEHSLGYIEDALLNFAVHDDRLVLDFDPLPLVTFDNYTLVSWRLATAVDRQLAGENRARLALLAAPEKAEPSETGEEVARTVDADVAAAPKKSVLRRIAVEQLRLTTSFDGEPRHFGIGSVFQGEVCRLDALEVTGAVRHEAAVYPDGAIEAKLAALGARVDRLAVGPLVVSRGRVELRDLLATVPFSGLAPRGGVRASLAGLAINDLALSLMIP